MQFTIQPKHFHLFQNLTHWNINYLSYIIYRDKIVAFFRELSITIFVTDLKEGLQRIIEWTYEKSDAELNADIEYLFDGLSYIEGELNFGIQKPFTWATNITPERFYEVLKSKASFAVPCATSFVSRIFIDTTVVDKITAIRFLLLRGYSLRHEVKGISRALVERIEATLTDEHQIEPVTEAIIDRPHDDDFKNPSPSVIFVPRSLWEGKSPKSVRDNMRQKDMDFPDHVIAYVLYNWCDLKNMTEIGTLLGEADKVPSTYLRYAHRLLAKAKTLNIQPA
jgi:hypothetical protein